MPFFLDICSVMSLLFLHLWRVDVCCYSVLSFRCWHWTLFQAVKADLEVKRPIMDKLCSMSQDLLSSVKNKEVASKLEARLDSFAQRWDRLIQSLEASSSQVLTSAWVVVTVATLKATSGSFVKRVCLQTDGSGVLFFFWFLSESNLCSNQTPWGLICAATKTQLWWNLSHGSCNSNMKWLERIGWANEGAENLREVCVSQPLSQSRRD